MPPLVATKPATEQTPASSAENLTPDEVLAAAGLSQPNPEDSQAKDNAPDPDDADDSNAPDTAPQIKTYTTKQGETFGDVVAKFGVDHVELQRANPDVNQHSVLVGTVLTIPVK